MLLLPLTVWHLLLQLLSLANCGVTDRALAALAAGCPLLNSLDLSGCHKITDAGVRVLCGLSGAEVKGAHAY